MLLYILLFSATLSIEPAWRFCFLFVFVIRLSSVLVCIAMDSETITVRLTTIFHAPKVTVNILFRFLELSSQVQQLIEENFKGRFPAETFSRTQIHLVGIGGEERRIE